MARDPEDDPASRDRRKLLLAFGFGAVNIVALRRIGTDVIPVERPPLPEVDPASATVELTTGTAAGTARAAVPPPLELDGSELPPEPPEGHVFDVVINGGRVMDPDSGFDGMASIGIDGTTITSISAEALTGRFQIDATGRIVAPGFVDLLSYEPNSFGVWLKLADGVTTNLAMHGVNNYAQPFFGRYENQTPIHYGGAFHHHFMRGFDIEASIGAPLNAGQFGELEGLVKNNLEQGLAGISFSPEYSPGTTSEEMERLAAVAAEFGHVCFYHLRHSDPNPPGTSLEALEEVLGIARTTGASTHIEHLTSTGGTFVMFQAINMINRARDEGLDITACLYPYDFWGTFLGSSRFSLGWQERFRLTETDLQIAGTDIVLSPESFNQAFRENKLVAALGSIPEEEIQMALVEPWVLVASDAIPTIEMNNHPRGAGTFARTIGRYVRELGVLDLMTGLSKITIGPVKRVESMIPAMARKGRLRRGADADIVVFNPVTIGDRATVELPAAPSVGIDWVLVDGQVALRDGVADKTVLAGRPLRSRI